MGLLDDAIREHLELKRRHGADAGEVARQEQEALGPARRVPAPLEVSEREADAGDAPESEAAGESEAPVYHEPDEPHGAVPMGDVEVPEPAAEAPAEPVVPERSEAVAPDADVDWSAPPPAESADDHGQPTVAFDAAEVDQAQRRPDPEREPDEAEREPGPSEDVLEETPDFLQETPEHDRLWFEQRPPRDFDFDE